LNKKTTCIAELAGSAIEEVNKNQAYLFSCWFVVRVATIAKMHNLNHSLAKEHSNIDTKTQIERQLGEYDL
jgi:hypothetical protein